MYNARVTYFQKIGNSGGRAPTVVVGNAFVAADLVVSFIVPRDPIKRHESVWGESPIKPIAGIP